MVIVTLSDKAVHPAVSVTSTLTDSKLDKSEKLIVFVRVVTPPEIEISFLKNSYLSPPEAVKITALPKHAVSTEVKFAVGVGSTVIVMGLLISVQSRPLNLEVIFLRNSVVVEIIAEGVRISFVAPSPPISTKVFVPVLLCH